MLTTAATIARRVGAYVQSRIDSWRTGSRGSQAYVLMVLYAGVALSLVLVWSTRDVVPFAVWFVWLLLGVLLLRFVPLVLLSVGVVAVAGWSSWAAGLTTLAVVGLAMLVLSVALVLYQSSRQRSGLPVTLSEATLAQLRDRLQALGRVPALPEGWRSHSSMLTAHGAGYAGDFVVADLREGRHLEMVLVDVCGKGVAVGPQALQFAGALGGLIGALPPHPLMHAANAFLLRQDSDESFATAVHLLVDLSTGDYSITSAGHPPALHWKPQPGSWIIDNARGLALGIIPEPELISSTGRLEPGEALMFYTDGVVESRGRDLDEGIEWLRDSALHAVERGFDGAPRRILRDVPRGVDDRALLILERQDEGRPVEATSRPAASGFRLTGPRR